MFAGLMLVSLATYVTVAYVSSNQQRPAIVKTQPAPDLETYTRLLDTSTTPPVCACSAQGDVLVSDAISWHPPTWGDLLRGSTGRASKLAGLAMAEDLGIQLPAIIHEVSGTSYPNPKCDALRPAMAFSEAAWASSRRLSNSQRCAAAITKHIWLTTAPLVERDSVLGQRLLSGALPRTLLTPTTLNMTIQRAVVASTVEQAGDFVAHMQSIFQGRAFFNPSGPLQVKKYIDVWEACAIPGTEHDAYADKAGCNCTDNSPFCTAEMWADPFHIYPSSERPSWVLDRPVRIGCSSTDFLDSQLTPEYYFRSPAFYGPHGLNCSTPPPPVDPIFPMHLRNAESDGEWSYRQPLPGSTQGNPEGYASFSELLWLPISRLSLKLNVYQRSIPLRPDLYSLNFTQYFHACAPISCTYTETQPPLSILSVFISALSLIGGLQIFWRSAVDISFDSVRSCCCKATANAQNTLSTFATYSEGRIRSRVRRMKGGQSVKQQREEEAMQGPVVLRT